MFTRLDWLGNVVTRLDWVLWVFWTSLGDVRDLPGWCTGPPWVVYWVPVVVYWVPVVGACVPVVGACTPCIWVRVPGAAMPEHRAVY